MVKVIVRFMSIVRQRAGTAGVDFDYSGQRLRELLNEVVARYPIGDIILAANGEVRPWARVLVNGRSHHLVGGLDVELNNGDQIALIYPYTEQF
jgi:molybdopterin converting factor small subunit